MMNRLQFVKAAFVLLALLLTSCAGTAPPARAQSPCPEGSETARELVEDFLTDASWSGQRRETQSTGLSAGAVRRVTDSAVCQQLNEKPWSSDLRNENIDPGDSSSGPAYEFSYYRAQNRYFAVFAPQQPADSDEVVLGYTYLDVYNSSLSRIKGYGF